MAANSLRIRGLTRLWLTALCVVTAAAGLAVSWRIDERAHPCWTVRQFIDFNRDTQASLKAKTHFAAAGSYEQDSVPTDADYQAWIDGMHRYADRVTAAGLSAHAQRAAALASEALTVRNRMGAELNEQKPWETHVPSAAKDWARVNHEFNAEMADLAHACPAG